MRGRCPAGVFAALSPVSLIGGCAMALLFPGARLIFVAAGFLGYLLCGRRAMALWKVDDRVFERRPDLRRHRVGPAGRLAPALFLAAAFPIFGQQTIFNVLTADVLDAGKIYVETDALWRSQTLVFRCWPAGAFTASGRASKPASTSAASPSPAVRPRARRRTSNGGPGTTERSP